MSFKRPTMLQYPVLVQGGEIAGVHPAGAIDCLRRALLIAPIPEHDRVAARAKLARRVGRDDAPLGVDDLHLDMRVNAADRADPALERSRRKRSAC